MKYIFGPVPSRRLGISLGVDLVPYKTCSFDCVYCECGRTTNLTIRRKEFIPYKQIIKELNRFLKQKPQLDYITFSGSGEPTLSTSLGKIINYLKRKFPQYKIAVLTNGSFLYRKTVRDDLKNADVVIPSLDAVSLKVFKKINRPHPKLKLEKIINGLIRFRNEFKGEVWLEIFIVKDINDSQDEIVKIQATINKINPVKVQFNTLDRPGTENWVKPISEKKLRKLTENILCSEVIAKFPKKGEYFHENTSSIEDVIVQILSRRPMTVKDLNIILDIRIVELQKHIRILLNRKKITEKKQARGIFYQLKK